MALLACHMARAGLLNRLPLTRQHRSRGPTKHSLHVSQVSRSSSEAGAPLAAPFRRCCGTSLARLPCSRRPAAEVLLQPRIQQAQMVPPRPSQAAMQVGDFSYCCTIRCSLLFCLHRCQSSLMPQFAHKAMNPGTLHQARGCWRFWRGRPTRAAGACSTGSRGGGTPRQRAPPPPPSSWTP